MKKLILPLISLILVILLNSILIASPLKPAVLFTTSVVSKHIIVERNTFVFPFTRWESRPRFLTGERNVPFADAGDDNVWIVQLTYSARHVDLLTPAGDWQTWLDNRLTTFLNNIYNGVVPLAPAGSDKDARVALYVEEISRPATLAMLKDALKSQFNEHYQGLLIVQGLKLEIRRITLAEFYSISE